MVYIVSELRGLKSAMDSAMAVFAAIPYVRGASSPCAKLGTGRTSNSASRTRLILIGSLLVDFLRRKTLKLMPPREHARYHPTSPAAASSATTNQNHAHPLERPSTWPGDAPAGSWGAASALAGPFP